MTDLKRFFFYRHDTQLTCYLEVFFKKRGGHDFTIHAHQIQ